MVLTLEINLERDKTGDVGKFQDTYIIHISKFMITRDHTLLIHQSIFATKTVWPFVVWHFAFQFVYYGKQWLDTFDDGYVDGIYLLRPVAKKCRLLWTYTRFVFNRVETKGGSVLCFSQDKLTYIFWSRRKCNYTAVSWIINVSASLVSFFCKFRSAVQTVHSPEHGVSTTAWKSPPQLKERFCTVDLNLQKKWN